MFWVVEGQAPKGPVPEEQMAGPWENQLVCPPSGFQTFRDG